MRLALLLWLAFLTAVSLAPTSLKWRMGTMGPLHSWGHFMAFFVTGALLCWNADRSFAWVCRCFAGFVIAAALEGMETAVYGNPFELRDLATDCLGVVAGAMIVAIAARLFSKIEKRRTDALASRSGRR